MASIMEISLLFASFVSLHADPDIVGFIPMPVIDRVSNDSITISWMPPAVADSENYYSYEVMRIEVDKQTEPPYSGIITSILTIRKLDPGTNHRFKVRACVINRMISCGDWSPEIEGHTRTNQDSWQ